jgi:hypothetical protein
MTIGERTNKETFLIAEIGDDEAILGIDWLTKQNPSIDWAKQTMTLPGSQTKLRGEHKSRNL